MSFLSVLRSAEAGAVQLPFPGFFFGLIAFSIFTLLVVVTWSYRDVANRHDHKGKDGNSH